MRVILAYIAVVAIWSTTPIAIKVSNVDAGFISAVTLRMTLGAILTFLLLLVLRMPFPLKGKAWKSYLAASIGVYGAMVTVYWAALFIPSGLISVIFGLSPIITGFIAIYLLGENSFTLGRVLALMVSLMGLVLIFNGELLLSSNGVWGLAALLLSVFLYCLSAVMIKKCDAGVSALAQTAGALLFSLPAYWFSWWVLDGQWPEMELSNGMFAIMYLALFGSVIGFALYFYILQRLPADIVALITLVTPVFSLWIGYYFADEVLNLFIIVGTTLIALGLVFYLWDKKIASWF